MNLLELKASTATNELKKIGCDIVEVCEGSPQSMVVIYTHKKITGNKRIAVFDDDARLDIIDRIKFRVKDKFNL